jgi:hypothetical protein
MVRLWDETHTTWYDVAQTVQPIAWVQGVYYVNGREVHYTRSVRVEHENTGNTGNIDRGSPAKG